MNERFLHFFSLYQGTNRTISLSVYLITHTIVKIPLMEWVMATLDTGGEVENAILGCLLHDLFEGRGAGLFRCFSPQPAH